MEKKSKKKKVVVVGDVWFDNVLIPISKDTQSDKKKRDWKGQIENNLGQFPLPGGALLIKETLNALQDKTNNMDIISYTEVNLEKLSNQEMIQALAEGIKVPGRKSTGDSYYIKKFLGYTDSGPLDGIPSFARDFTFEPSRGKNVIIIDDANKGFRNVENAWKHTLEKLEKNKNSVIIYNMSMPLFTGNLWETLSQKDLLNRTILIISANSLRDEGVNISRKLSWDRTIADFTTILAYKKYKELEECPHTLIRFGLEGVIYYYHSFEKNNGKEKASMFYAPNLCEDETIEDTPGMMKGLSSAFTGFLARQIIWYKDSTADLSAVIKEAVSLAADQVIQLSQNGYKKDNDRLFYPFKKVLSENSPGLIKKIDLHDINTGYLEGSRKHWSILSHRIPLDYHLKDIAIEYVINGEVNELKNVPVVRFGKLLTVDKNEIENFRSIKNLFKEYIKDLAINKPLSIAVFGPPGSGKSFAVKSVANSVLSVIGKKADVLEYNLSQFESPQDIIRAFHEVRDYSLKGATPLVFFDEFDSSYKNDPLGWIKYFLAPMQDGEFKEGEKTHPIGRAIFIFAGGTNRSLNEFTGESESKKQKNSAEFQHFIAAKGPDFVSRLKGYINILGPNPIDRESHQNTAPRFDRFFIIRRAVLLRVLLLQQKSIVDGDKRIRIDEDVLRALLLIPKYKHGARSMSAIINMSMLGGRDRFEKAALPSPEQLRLHLDAYVFMNILDRDLIINIASIDRAIHEVYLSGQKQGANSEIENHSSKTDWDNLDEEVKQLNRMLAENIPYYLLLINCSYHPKPGKPEQENQLMQFTEEEIDYLAKMAHERWRHEKRSKGWVYGKRRDDEKKIHNCLVPWKQLPEDDKKVDRTTIKSIPRMLDSAGFEVYRL